MRPHEFSFSPVNVGCRKCVELEARVVELEEFLLVARCGVADLEARVVSEEAMHRLEVERITGRSEDEEGDGVDIG
jgi:hypothetical protein